MDPEYTQKLVDEVTPLLTAARKLAKNDHEVPAVLNALSLASVGKMLEYVADELYQARPY